MQKHRILFSVISAFLIAGGIACAAQTSEWVWMNGSQIAGAAGVYGTQGVAAAGNSPGARQDAFTWTDASGNLWLFGGIGEDSAGTQGDLNDLWEFNPSTNQWTWVSGSKAANATAECGTPGVWSTTYIPGSRDSGVTWIDKNGNLWLFGGQGYDCSDKQGLLNDLWEYDPSSQEWTMVSGGQSANTHGVYGTQGVASATNIPGAREGEDSGGILPGWTDSDGNFWLFGGKGYDSAGTVDSLNDLWEYSPASGMWTWVSGSSTVDGTGVYGTQGIAEAGNTPSARQSAQAWKDADGNFWLHGGYAPDVTCVGSPTYMCADSPEMWEFNPITKEWTWISGQDSANTAPVYGTQGVASDTSNPGGREMAATWVGLQGNLWLFSGYAFDGQANNAPDDLWMYNTTTNQWTWVEGNSGANQPSVYGTLGVPAATNWPDSRGIEGASATWTDAQGNIWLLGGDSGNNSNGGYLQNDLWVYHASPAATPIFSISGGTYTTTQTVTISDTTPGATIYYTTNGATPTASSSVYSSPLAVPSTQTIKAVAIASGYPTSAVATATYTFLSTTTTTVTTTLNPATANYNLVPFTVTVIGSGSNKPTGTVALWIGSKNFGSAGIDYTGKATITVGTLSSYYCADCLSAGQYQVTAVYSGDTNNAGSTSAVLNEVVQPDTTRTTATSSWYPNPAPLNSPVKFTATVTLEYSGVNSSDAPDGTVTFKDGSSVIGTGTLTTSDGITSTATLTTSSLAAGAHSITATYSGDSVNAASTSTAFTQAVSFITPTVSVTPAASSITTTQSVSVAVTVSGGTGNPTPTGSVMLNGGGFASVATALSGGTAIITIPANTLGASSYTFKASYTPDTGSSSIYNSATGSSGAVTVSKATPTVTVILGASNITTSQSLSVNVAVSGGAGNPTPTGTVMLTSSSYTSPAAKLSGGSAMITIPAGSLTVGSDTLMASYTPDSNSSSEYSTATGTTSSPVMVTAPTPAFSISSSGNIAIDQGATTSNTSTVTITPINGFTGAVALSCSVTTAPTSATSPVTCDIPSSVAITGAGAQTATLTANSTPTTTTGTYAITITAQSGSISQTAMVNVTINPAPRFTSGPDGTTSMSVTPGSTTGNTGTINVVGTNGFSGTVSLSCSVATTMSSVNDMPTCSLNPTSVTISGTTAQSSKLTVNTTAATSAENHTQTLIWPSSGGMALALVMFFVTPRRRRNWLSFFGVFVFIAIIGASGCGGGSSVGGGGGGASNPGTTAGTYTVTVTGTDTSSGLSSSITATVGTVTLTVN